MRYADYKASMDNLLATTPYDAPTCHSMAIAAEGAPTDINITDLWYEHYIVASKAILQ